MNYIKNLTSEQIDKFYVYSKIYSKIIELENNIDFGNNIYNEVNNILENSLFIFEKDSDVFLIGKNLITISKEELIKLKK